MSPAEYTDRLPPIRKATASGGVPNGGRTRWCGAGVAGTRPLLSVKIENTPEARPQTGLELADIVWNEVVEGQITRFLAMYQSRSTDVVGPIRSVRKTDPLIVWPVGGVFAYSGGAPWAGQEAQGRSWGPVVDRMSRAASAFLRAAANAAAPACPLG